MSVKHWQAASCTPSASGFASQSQIWWIITTANQTINSSLKFSSMWVSISWSTWYSSTLSSVLLWIHSVAWETKSSQEKKWCRALAWSALIAKKTFKSRSRSSSITSGTTTMSGTMSTSLALFCLRGKSIWRPSRLKLTIISSNLEMIGFLWRKAFT